MQQAIGAIENALLDIKAKRARRAGLRAVRRAGPRPIRLYWSHCGTYRVGARAASCELPQPSHARRHRRARQGGRRERLHGAQDERHAAATATRAATARASRAATSFPELNPERYVLDADPGPARGVPRGRRPGHGHPGRPELQLQDRGLPESGPGDGAVRPVLGRDGHAQPRGAALHPRGHDDPGRLVRDAVRPARVPAVLRARLRWTRRSSTCRGTASGSR